MLVPVDYDNPSTDKTLLKDSTVSLQRLQERMEDKNSLVNLCIIDACRENPFASETRALASGLAAATAPAEEDDVMMLKTATRKTRRRVATMRREATEADAEDPMCC